MNTMRFPTALAAALLLVACSDESAGVGSVDVEQAVEATDSPDDAIEAGANALKNNDVKAFMAVVLPPSEMERVRQEYEEERQNAPVSESDRQEFEATMTRLTAEGAEEQIMAELEPQLDQMAAQMPMMIGFGQMMVVQGIQQNQEMTEDQRKTAEATANAIFTKLQATNLADKEKAREAVGVVTATARDLDLQTIEDVRALNFDQALGKAGEIMAGAKQVLAIYDIDLNAMLDSVEADVVSEQGDQATVQVSYDLFGTQQSTQTQMVRKDGRWFGAGLLDQIEKERQADANEMTDSASEMDMDDELDEAIYDDFEEVPEEGAEEYEMEMEDSDG